MIRSLHPTDVLRYVLFQHPEETNRVQVLEDLVIGKPRRLTFPQFCKEGISTDKRGHSLIWVAGKHILGLGSVRERSGPKSWEISQLYLNPSIRDLDCIELFERLSQIVAEHGGERIFLRILAGDPIENIGQRAGFFAYFQEQLFRGTVNDIPESNKSTPPLRTRFPHDNHALFRLYNATVPHKIRVAVGLTMEEWRDSQERCSGKCEESVHEHSGTISASLRITSDSKRCLLEVATHPEEDGTLTDILALGLNLVGTTRTACVIVPEYQPSLQFLLSERGLKKESNYVVMIKMTAKRVGNQSVAPTEAAPIGG